MKYSMVYYNNNFSIIKSKVHTQYTVQYSTFADRFLLMTSQLQCGTVYLSQSFSQRGPVGLWSFTVEVKIHVIIFGFIANNN